MLMVVLHIRVHIRTAEGNAQFTASKSARSLHIRPQRKFACSRFFQISSIFRALLSVYFSIPLQNPPQGTYPFPYLTGGFDVCIIIPYTQFVNRLIPLFSKMHFAHDCTRPFLQNDCAFPLKVVLLQLFPMANLNLQFTNRQNV